MNDTIFAVSSGAPPAAIAIMRISGPEAFGAVASLTGDVPKPRRATLRALSAKGELLDRALVLIFPGPHSVTGEDLAELHLHGGRAVVRIVESTLAALPGLRHAEPGEFTRRALANGRIDLSEAEGLADLLTAETEDQRRVALRVAEGGLRHMVEQWSNRSLMLSARVEAALDHSDEDDVEETTLLPAVRQEAATLASEIAEVASLPPVERLRDGVRVALAGPPNAGKSTLLNALVGRDVAIVSPIAGTTRDAIEAPVIRGGMAYILTDTAGLTNTPGDAIEAIGIARAQRLLEAADILVWLGDGPAPRHPHTVRVHARADMPGRTGAQGGAIAVSALEGTGLHELWDNLQMIARTLLPPPDLIALNARQRSLSSAAANALGAASEEADTLLMAEHLRVALRAFDAITGQAGVEQMLDALFARFCIGK